VCEVTPTPGSWYTIQICILKMDPQGCYMFWLMLVIKIISIFCDVDRSCISYEHLENLRFSRLLWVCFNIMSLSLNNRTFVTIRVVEIRCGTESEVKHFVSKHFGNLIKKWFEFLQPTVVFLSGFNEKERAHLPHRLPSIFLF
jgi:hypothetical protein